jgi:hypothetical protein
MARTEGSGLTVEFDTVNLSRGLSTHSLQTSSRCTSKVVLAFSLSVMPITCTGWVEGCIIPVLAC